MDGWTPDVGEPAQPLTHDMLAAAFDKIASGSRYKPPCGSKDSPHLMPPRALCEDGWYRCQSCMNMVPVKDGRVDYSK